MTSNTYISLSYVGPAHNVYVRRSILRDAKHYSKQQEDLRLIPPLLLVLLLLVLLQRL